jgi:YgiT-type zinc finger domain-containing protein
MAHSLNESLWRQLSEEITTGMREWRNQQPKATLREIETELDARLSRARARMLEDLALASTAATWQEAARLQSPSCPECGTPLDERGTHPRTLLTHGGQELTLQRSYGVCPKCGSGFFPAR